MSRIGKKPIIIPGGVEVKIDGQKVTIKGPKGEISKEFRPEVKIGIKDDKIFVYPSRSQGWRRTNDPEPQPRVEKNEHVPRVPQLEKLGKKKFVGGRAKKIKSFWGLTRMLVANMIEGVITGFEKKLEIEGIGFKVEVAGQELVLYVGFSYPVKLKIPEGIKILLDKKMIIVSGINKELVGQFASIIRKVKPPEPYKGKGIKYLGEIIRRKVGKKVVTASGK